MTSRVTESRRRCLRRDDSGTATLEAALVLTVITVFLFLSPLIYKIWIHEQIARTEAHRDVFDKTTMFVHMPEQIATDFGAISEAQRRHIFPGFSIPHPDFPDQSPSPLGPLDLDPEGLPNRFVEGWQRQKFDYSSGKFTGQMKHMRYAATIRSPWTWLGYPFIPTQDMFFERPKVVEWYEGEYESTIDQDMMDALKLLDN